MTFVFDLDDTMCETDAYSEFYIKNFIKTHNLPYKFVGSYARFAETKFNWDKDTANAWYKQYGDQMMIEFPVKGNSVEVVNQLYDLGHKIVICTARETDWHTDPVGLTKTWCKNVGLKYHKILIGRVDKASVCKEEKADVFVDDDIKLTSKVAQYFKTRKKQGFVFLANSNYNSTLEADPDVVRISSFEEILKLLKIK